MRGRGSKEQRCRHLHAGGDLVLTSGAQLAVLVDRVDALIDKVSKLELRLNKQEHWRTYLIGAATVIGCIGGYFLRVAA